MNELEQEIKMQEIKIVALKMENEDLKKEIHRKDLKIRKLEDDILYYKSRVGE